MEDNKYEKIRANVFNFLQSISYSEQDRDIISDRIAQEICDETAEKMKYCTKKQTEAFRSLMGMDNEGERQKYTSVDSKLSKTNTRGLVHTATTRLIRGIRGELLEEETSQSKRKR